VISDVLGEAWRIYARLFRRSVVVAGLIFAVVALAQAFATRNASAGATLVALLLAFLGGLLVQGALVLVVRDLHEGREPEAVNEYYEQTRGRLGTLFSTSLLYSLAAILIIPLARWALAVPLVMIERLDRREAFARSSELVRGRTGRVLALILIAGAISGVIHLVVSAVFGSIPGLVGLWIAGTVGSAIAAPYGAHVLTVLYYRLTEPERPVLPDEPPRETWRSVWDEEPRE
jgi:hypothetical protein